MEWMMIWLVTIATSQGAVNAKMPESTKFKSEAECRSFGEQHVERMQDWTRGVVRADWDHPVRVDFDCRPGGSPA